MHLMLKRFFNVVFMEPSRYVDPNSGQGPVQRAVSVSPHLGISDTKLSLRSLHQKLQPIVNANVGSSGIEKNAKKNARRAWHLAAISNDPTLERIMEATKITPLWANKIMRLIS